MLLSDRTRFSSAATAKLREGATSIGKVLLFWLCCAACIQVAVMAGGMVPSKYTNITMGLAGSALLICISLAAARFVPFASVLVIETVNAAA
jgi:hypothetical protein